ncbi:MAG: hypothetical protein HY582_01200 [Candidatus Omnitrophica bacterium]|nr:hypothetical protein [Candidatus Omnitrophota bacterium]
MFFGKKTVTETKEQFALVLNPVRGELAKSRMIERMIQVFPLTLDEASDLVENTPIILLEGLEAETGEQVKQYFSHAGADLVLTDDSTFKRRCFRAIWPSPPKFDFLQVKEGAEPYNDAAPTNGKEKNEFLNGHFKTQPEHSSVQFDRTPVMPAPRPESAPKEKETRLPDFSPSNPSTTHRETVMNQGFEKRSEEIESPSQANESWNKDHLHKIELTTNNAIQEEKIAYLTNEKDKLHALVLKLQKENDELKTEHLKALQFKKDLEELRKSLSGLEAERVRLSEEVKTHQLEESALLDKLRELEANRLTFVKEKENEIRLLEERFQRSETSFREDRVKAEAQISELKGTVQSQKLEVDNARDKLKIAQEELKTVETELKRFRNEEAVLRAENQELKRLFAQSQQVTMAQKREFETTQSRLEEKVIETTSELESWRRKSEEWSTLHSKLVREIEGLRQKYANEVESVTARSRELQAQLEIAQRQVREFASVVEQQDMVNKRNRIAVELSDKEAKLKELALRQEMLANDLRDREQILGTIAAERQTIEKEILKDRQAQKYLVEQLKLKEKNRILVADRFGRVKERGAEADTGKTSRES